MINSTTLTIKQVAERLHYSYQTVYRMIRNGNIKAHRIGKGWRIYERDIETQNCKSEHSDKINREQCEKK